MKTVFNFAIAASLLVARDALAEDPQVTPSKKDEGQVVVTGTRTPERVQRATVKTDVVTREEAERRGATNVAEALASQPGLVVNPGTYGFLGGVSALQIQGFDRDRVLILEDGERVVGDVGGAIDLSAIPTGDIERIEVVTGPTSSLYGSAAIGGVVNIITAPPRDFGPSGRARAEYRSQHGVVLQGNLAYKLDQKLQPWLGLDGNFTRQDGLEKQSDLPDLRIPESDRRMIGVRGGAKVTDDMDVRVRFRAFRDHFDGLETKTAPGLGRYILDEPSQTNRYTFHLIHVTKLGKKGSNLRLTLGRQWYDNYTSTQYRDSPIYERHDRTQRLQSFEGVGTIADGPRTWVVGARMEAENFHQEVTKTNSTADGVVSDTTPEVTPLAYGIGALYGQLSWKFGKLTVMPGARFEAHTRYGDSLSPRLAAAYKANEWIIIRASGGRGFRAPSAKELGFVFDHSIYGYKVLGNDNLQPEKSWGVNLDATLTPWKNMTARGSVFANWVDDLIDLDLAHGTTEAGISSYRYTNFGKARTAGGQVDFAYEPTSFLRAEASYAYTWTRDDVNDQPLAGRPPHSVTTALRFKPGPGFEIYARSRIVTNAFLDAETRAPGYGLFDVRIGHVLWPHSQFYGGVLDLTDVKQDPNRIGDTRPPFGRTFYVGLKADFPWEDE